MRKHEVDAYGDAFTTHFILATQMDRVIHANNLACDVKAPGRHDNSRMYHGRPGLNDYTGHTFCEKHLPPEWREWIAQNIDKIVLTEDPGATKIGARIDSWTWKYETECE